MLDSNRTRRHSKMDWLDTSGRLLKGKYKGRLAESIAKEDMDYLEWIVNEVEDCSDEDREVLGALLTWGGR